MCGKRELASALMLKGIHCIQDLRCCGGATFGRLQLVISPREHTHPLFTHTLLVLVLVSWQP